MLSITLKKTHKMEINNEVKKIIQSKFLSQEKFSIEIERYVLKNNCNYIDGIVQYCEENEIELDIIPKLISKPLKEKLKNNATELNFLKKVTKSRKII
jgi:hypothetical protein